jgi:hypothetical protein
MNKKEFIKRFEADDLPLKDVDKKLQKEIAATKS